MTSNDISALCMNLPAAIDEIFGPSGELARFLPQFETRTSQVNMARDVAAILEKKKYSLAAAEFLAVEAGTGTGKTLAYLIPAALCGRKVIVSTGTKNLQDQILQKEIPFLQRHIAPGLKAMCVKGRQNYLCLHRWQQSYSHPQGGLFEPSPLVRRLSDWVGTTALGDRAEIPWLEDTDPLWQEISATSSQCLGSHCPANAGCFINRVRQQAARADIVIVNHHLFFSDLALRRGGHAEALPRYEAVIFDEAHHLEDVAGQYFGLSISSYQLIDLVLDLEKMAHLELKGKKRSGLLNKTAGLKQITERLLAFFPPEPGRFPLLPFIEMASGWRSLQTELIARLDSLAEMLAALSSGGDGLAALQNRCLTYCGTLLALEERDERNKIYWFERRKKSLSLIASPIEIADELQAFYRQIACAVFASATLTVGSSFDYFIERLGLPPDTETRIVLAPFSYESNSLLYIPEDTFPPPGSPDFQRQGQQRILGLLRASQGRALVLFTSLESMHSCAAFLTDAVPYPLLVQGTAPKQVLLDRFRKQTHSVLLAVASFWEGVDVPGQALSSLIIDKLPFEVPSDPVLQARLQHIREKGENPFMHFQVPRAILTLRQGLGRLIRSSTDWGVMAILDVRLFTKPYGHIFRKSLPSSPLTRDLEDVQLFFAAHGEE